MINSKVSLLSLLIEANEDGFLVSCPDIQGAFAEGDTVEEAIFNCIDVVKMISAYRADRGESVGIKEFELVPNSKVAVSFPIGIAA
jgi:predicted RNase H-like HicB family nuclease